MEKETKIAELSGAMSKQTKRVELQEMNLVEQNEVFDGLKKRIDLLEQREVVHAQKDVMLRQMQRSVAHSIQICVESTGLNTRMDSAVREANGLWLSRIEKFAPA